MKVHVQTRQGGDKQRLLQWIGLERPTLCWEVRAWWELTPAELAILSKQTAAKRSRLFYYSYHGLELSPTTETFVRCSSVEEGFRFVAYHPADAALLETQIRDAARLLKVMLDGVVGLGEPRVSSEEI